MQRISTFFIASEANNFHPPALSYKAFLIYGVLMLVLRFFLGAVPAGGAAVESQSLMPLINKERSARNLLILAANSSLLTAAQAKSQDMIDRDYFAHVDPDGNYVWPKIIAAGYGAYKILGENLALDFLTSEGMIKAWLDSPTHRANLLHEDFRDQGLSALYGDYEGRYTNLTASLFGAKPQNPPPPPEAPIATPPPQPIVKSTPPALPPPPTPEGVGSPTESVGPEPSPLPVSEPAPPPLPAKIPEMNLGGQAPTPSPMQTQSKNFAAAFTLSRIVFTLLGMLLLGLLAVDAVIIHRHESMMPVGAIAISRSHSSYHLTSFVIISLVSILIWWW